MMCFVSIVLEVLTNRRFWEQFETPFSHPLVLVASAKPCDLFACVLMSLHVLCNSQSKAHRTKQDGYGALLRAYHNIHNEWMITCHIIIMWTVLKLWAQNLSICFTEGFWQANIWVWGTILLCVENTWSPQLLSYAIQGQLWNLYRERTWHSSAW